MKITCKKIGINGEGIGYDHRTPVFCDGILVDEVADVTIIEDKKRYKIAKLNKLLKQSKDRQQPICPIQNTCGGCAFMITNYHKQKEYKTSLLKEALQKYANINGSIVRHIHTDNRRLYYRNQCKLPVEERNGKLIAGMYSANSNHFIGVKTCYIHDKKVEKIKKHTLDILNKYHFHSYTKKDKTGIRFLVIRVLENQSHLTIVTGNTTLSKEVIQDLSQYVDSIFQCINTKKETIDILSGKMIHHFGNETITLHLNNTSLSLSPRSFFQLNYDQALALYDMAISKIDPCDTLVECYCGIGAMSFLAKDKAKHIIGIENIQDAVDNANDTAKKHHYDHIQFYCMDAANGLYKAASRYPIDTLLVDPPRSGLDDAMLEAILTTLPNKMIYISCNPSTLAKNLAVLKDAYRIHTIIPFDLFPQTPHIESISVLSRKK